MPAARITRRELLLLGASALVTGCTVERPESGFYGALQHFNGKVQAALQSSSKLAEAAPANERTPLDAFPIYHVGPGLPAVPPGWALEVGGLVEQPLRLMLDELVRLPRTEMRVRHHCVEGWSAVASWHGVRLADLARAARARPEAKFVEFVSFEAGVNASGDAKAAPGSSSGASRFYTSSWDLESATHPQTLIAYGMNGAPLGIEHGGPARLYSANKLGYKMVKWLRAIHFLDRPTGGYWEDQGYEWFAGI